MTDLRNALELLQIPPPERTKSILERLTALTASIKFFIDLAEKSDNLHYDCCGRMKLAEYNTGQYIFRQFDKGTFFCIILKGSVSVQLLKQPIADFIRANPHVTADMKDVIASACYIRSKTDESEEKEVLEKDFYNTVAILGVGASFGELSLLKHQPRAATIRCEEACSVAVVSSEDYNELLKSIEEKRLTEKTSFMSTLPLFKGWTKAYLEKTSFYFNERVLRRNQVVFREGEPCEYFYIIKEGEFKTTKRLSSFKEKSSLERLMRKHSPLNSKINLVIRGPGELLGDEELVKDLPHTTTCECISSWGKLLMISQKDMRSRVSQPQTWDYLASRYEKEEQWMLERIKTLEEVANQKPELPSILRITPELTPRRTRNHSSMQAAKSPELTMQLTETLPKQTKTIDYTDLDVLRRLTKFSKPKAQRSLSPKKVVRSSYFRKQSTYKPPPNFFATPTAALAFRARRYSPNVR
mmetsp:Transcript_1183/g.2889  ORF Transcript_1183/g.2889 Transcript_1183/m.2889 type:complete len:470 (+) Transcript_1183:7340-8749(+)